MAALPAPLHYRALKHNLIKVILSNNSLEGKGTLSDQAQRELDWWIQNLNLYNRKFSITPPDQIIISSDASSKGWGISCHGQCTRRLWPREERKSHINVLELKVAIMTFTMSRKVGISIHVGMDNMAAFSLLRRMGWTKKTGNGINQQEDLGLPLATTAEYLLGVKNIEAGRKSENLKGSSKW